MEEGITQRGSMLRLSHKTQNYFLHTYASRHGLKAEMSLHRGRQSISGEQNSAFTK